MIRRPPRSTLFPYTTLFRSRGQEIAVEVDADKAVEVPLKAGEMSLHHVKLAHYSGPNTTDGRRIGLAIRYIPPHVHQLKVRDSATLVRGRDTGGHYELEPAPRADRDEAAMAAHRAAMERQVAALYSGTDKTAFRAWTGGEGDGCDPPELGRGH